MILLSKDIDQIVNLEDYHFSVENYTDSLLIKKDFEVLGVLVWKRVENIIYFDEEVFNHYHFSSEEFHQYFNLVVERFTRLGNIEKLIYLGQLHKARLKSHLFFQKGKQYQRLIEPWRYTIDHKAFDEEGFIIDQNKTEVLPFGFTNSKRAGCGWISAYNLLKLNHKEQFMSDVFFGLSHNTISGEVFGQNVYALYFWLKKQNVKVKMTQLNQKRCMEQMKYSTSGILLYYHRRGSHFVTYKKLEDGRFHFYNAVYGKHKLIMSIEDFMNQYTMIPMNFLIYIK